VHDRKCRVVRGDNLGRLIPRTTCLEGVICKEQLGLRAFSCKMCTLDVGCGSEKYRPLVRDQMASVENLQIFSLCPFSPDTSPIYVRTVDLNMMVVTKSS
jgi:hypothetical protein